jgi:hypothetical protein
MNKEKFIFQNFYALKQPFGVELEVVLVVLVL